MVTFLPPGGGGGGGGGAAEDGTACGCGWDECNGQARRGIGGGGEGAPGPTRIVVPDDDGASGEIADDDNDDEDERDWCDNDDIGRECNGRGRRRRRRRIGAGIVLLPDVLGARVRNYRGRLCLVRRYESRAFDGAMRSGGERRRTR
jgi:hypothetical protein